jgi:hypothetical protein
MSGPAGMSPAGIVGEFGEHALGLADEAGDHGNGSKRVPEPSADALGELRHQQWLRILWCQNTVRALTCSVREQYEKRSPYAIC